MRRIVETPGSNLKKTSSSEDELERTAIAPPADPTAIVKVSSADPIAISMMPDIKPPPGLALASTMPLSKLPNISNADTFTGQRIKMQQLATEGARKTSRALIVVALLITLAAVALGIAFHFDIRF